MAVTLSLLPFARAAFTRTWAALLMREAASSGRAPAPASTAAAPSLGADEAGALPLSARCSRTRSTASWSSITSHTPSQATIMNWDCRGGLSARDKSAVARVIVRPGEYLRQIHEKLSAGPQGAPW